MKRLLLLLCVMLPCFTMAQGRIVKGIVFGPNNTPIEGVAVCAVGSTESTTTDKGGNFELSVSPYATFVEAKMEGFITSRAEIDGSFLMIHLKQDKKYWEEKAKAEAAERLAAEKAEAARLKAEEEARIAEQKRIEAERLAAEKAEAARLKAEEDSRLAEQKRIEAERLAAEKAEAARLKAETAHLKAEEGAYIADEAEKKLVEKMERREQWSETQKGYASIVEYESFTGFGEKSIFSNSVVKYIAGYKLNNQLFLGAGLGVNLNYHSAMVDNSQPSDGCYLNPSLISLPIFAYFRVNILNRRCSPFIAAAGGVSFSPNQTIHFMVGDAKHSNLSPFINPQLGINFRISTYRSIYLAAGLQCRAAPYVVEYTGYNVTLKPGFCYGLTLQLGFMF